MKDTYPIHDFLRRPVEAPRERPVLFSIERRWSAAAARIGVTAVEYVAALNEGKKVCGGCLKALPRDKDDRSLKSGNQDDQGQQGLELSA
jgi:hypothetical protein